jgi:hypothetical protein
LILPFPVSVLDGDIPFVFFAVFVGFIQSGDIVLVFYAFMGQSTGDISKLAVRTGLMLALRQGSMWLFLPLQDTTTIFAASIGFMGVVSCVIFPLLILKAPASYKDFKLPDICNQVVSLPKLRCPLLIGLSNALRGLTYAPSLVFIVWRAGAPRPDTFQAYITITMLATLLTPALLAILMIQLPKTAVTIVKVFSCFSFPVIAFRCWPMLEVAHASEMVLFIDAMSVVSVVLDILYQMASSVTLVSTLGSRWRFAVFMVIMTSMTSLTEAMSYGSLFFVPSESVEDRLRADRFSVMDMKLEELMHPEHLTTNLLMWSMVPCLPEMICRVLAFRYFDQEFLPMLWTTRNQKMERLLHRK